MLVITGRAFTSNLKLRTIILLLRAGRYVSTLHSLGILSDRINTDIYIRLRLS